MYALLIHKKPSPIEGHTRFLFAPRSMTCYNGMNTQGAMEAQINSDSLFVDIPDANLAAPSVTTDATFLAGAKKYSDVTVAERDNRGWELLGLGYVNDVIMTPPAVTGYDPLRLDLIGRRANRNANYANLSSYVGHLLKRECIFGQYYDAVLQETVATRRERTPNELLLAKLLGGTCMNRGSGMSYRDRLPLETAGRLFKESSMYRMLLGWEQFDGMTFEIVGSERPSGLAVTYLQAWRNTVQMWTLKPETHTFITSTVRSIALRGESVIPILSALYQGSDDSDILSYAGVPFQHACFKHTIWNMARFYRTSHSMIDEGRYNKGGQSSHIRNAVARAYPQSAVAGHVDLLNLNETFRHVANTINHFSAQNLAAYNYDVEQVVAQYRQRYQAQIRANAESPAQKLGHFVNQARQAPSFLAPVTPPARTDGAAQGFVAWVSNTEAEATIH